MHDCLNPVLCKNTIQQNRIAQAAFNKGSADKQIAVPTRKIIQYNNFVACLKQIKHHVRPDIACAAHNKNGFTGHDVVSR
jgi:hypothetical protein